MNNENQPCIKGQVVKSFLHFLDNEVNDEEKKRLFDNIPEPYRELLFKNKILATDLIPTNILNQLINEAAAIKKETVKDFARRVGRFSAGENLTGVYRSYARVLTPSNILSNTPLLWGSISNTGTMAVEEINKNHGLIKLFDYPAEPAFCERIVGWAERVVEMTNAKDVVVTHSKCRSRGESYCEWQLQWRD